MALHAALSPITRLLLLTWGCISWAHGQPPALENLVAQHNLAGMSVVTRCGDAISTEVHGGLRNIAAGLPVNAQTTYRVASISKAVVALAAAKLAEQGTLDLDAALGQYLEDPPFHPQYENTPLTLRHLLTHTSGIRDGSGYSAFLSATYSGIPEVPALSAVLATDGPFYSADMWGNAGPGAYFQYANLNFGVAATVMEAATGLRFDQLMTDLLFAPFGIDGGFTVQDLDDVADLAVLYRQVNGAWTPQADDYGGTMPTAPNWAAYAPGTNAVGFAPQGGLRTSARHLSVLARLWSHGSAPGADGAQLNLLAPETLAALKAEQWGFDGSNGNNYYGLFNRWSTGLHLAASGLGSDEVIPDVTVSPFVGHPGEAYGLISDAYATPQGEWNVVFLTNGKWDGYSAGPASAFYAVEQDVFAAVRADLLQCLSQGVPNVEAGVGWTVIGMPRSGDTLLQLQSAAPIEGPIRWEFVDGQGRLWCQGHGDGGHPRTTLEVPPMAAGVHFGSIHTADGRAARFVFVVSH